MTYDVVTAAPDTSLDEIATLMEKKLDQAGADRERWTARRHRQPSQSDPSGGHRSTPILRFTGVDTAIRDKLLAHLKTQPWAHTALLNVTVNDGVVDLWGMTSSETERTAIRVAAESMSGVRAVNDRLVIRRAFSQHEPSPRELSHGTQTRSVPFSRSRENPARRDPACRRGAGDAGPAIEVGADRKEMGRPDRLQRRRHHRQGIRPQGSGRESRCADAATGGREDRRRGRRRHQHRDDPGARHLRRRTAQCRRRRQRDRPQARPRSRR